MVVVFDIDGTLLDSAAGIVACFAAALRSVGFEPPDEVALRSDLGPPVGDVFTGLGLPADRLEPAVAAYRRLYHRTGLSQSIPYPGVVELLGALEREGIALATATAKRTETADAILSHHGLDGCFSVINGTDDVHLTKAQTLAHTLALLGDPAPGDVVMVGDRHSDITAAQLCGVRPVAVSWGYGSADELGATGATIIDRPHQLLELLGID